MTGLDEVAAAQAVRAYESGLAALPLQDGAAYLAKRVEGVGSRLAVEMDDLRLHEVAAALGENIREFVAFEGAVPLLTRFAWEPRVSEMLGFAAATAPPEERADGATARDEVYAMNGFLLSWAGARGMLPPMLVLGYERASEWED